MTSRTRLHNRLVFQLGFPFFVLIVFLSVAVGIISYRSYVKDLDKVQSIPARVAKEGQEGIEEFFDQLHQDIMLASRAVHVPLHEDAGAFLQDIVHTNPSIIEFAVFDQVGNEIYTAEEVTAHIAIPSEDITSEDYFIQTIEHKKEYISDPLVSVYNTPYIIWALPIILEDSSVVVIRAIVDLSTLWE